MEAVSDQDGAGRAFLAPTDAEFERFRRLILRETGISLRDTKRTLLSARLAQRLKQLGLESFSGYYDYLAADTSGEELIVLINRITTNKTSFFREPHHFDFLTTHVIPEPLGSACASGARAVQAARNPTRQQLRCGKCWGV